MGYRITIDTGGTFTDAVVADEAGTFTLGKALTTRDRIYRGMESAIQAAAEEIGLSVADLLGQTDLLVYGTTRATNAIVTKTAAKTAFLTTKGFPDILLIKEGGKHNPHDFTTEFPDPYIPRRHTFEIDERINAEGGVVKALSESQARETLAAIKARGFEAIAVCLLWSVANPAHELALKGLIEELLPEVPVTLSHQLIPIVREYRRASATAIDASLKPLMQQHLRGLESDLRAAGYRGEILVSTAAGGCNHVEALTEKPIYTVGSGPAMAPIAGITYSTLEKMGENVIVCDTGGTTFDVGLVRDGRLVFARDTWLGPRFTGDLLGISAVDMRSIGAGGGSIAWIDNGGLMRVGPQSAGADPGPACYGLGGSEPTVSDAAAVLGYFDPDYFLGGRMTLDVGLARQAIGKVAERIGLSIEKTAFQVLTLASDLMIKAIQDITINEGFNPRDSSIVAGGGAAGINILPIAKELGCEQVILPKVASVLSASGMQYADIVAEEAASFVTRSDRFNYEAVNAVLDSLQERLEAFRRTLPAREAEEVHFEFLAECRYLAQVWELDAPLPAQRFRDATDLKDFVEGFHDIHERVFAMRDEGSPVEIVNWKARLIVSLGGTRQSSPAMAIRTPDHPTTLRQCYFGGEDAVATPIYKATDLSPGDLIAGPAIIEEPTTTLVVYPGLSAQVSGAGNYLLR